MTNTEFEQHLQLTPNFEKCEQEQIHIPGMVQSFGSLIAFDKDLVITRASENVNEVLGKTAQELIGKSMYSVIAAKDAEKLLRRSSHTASDISSLRRFHTLAGAEAYALIHDTGDEFYLDVVEHGDIFDPLEATQSFLRAISASTTHADCLETITREIRRLTNFDRVKIYKFDKDWNGEVVAESRDQSMPSYLKLHFPESDIPKQARELYLRNRVRVIGDIDDKQSAVIQKVGLKPLDLSFSFIRSVSPIHLQYLRNMGIASSLSISIVHGGQFWGLIACHHRSPRIYTLAEQSFYQTVSTGCASRLAGLRQVEESILQQKSLAFLQNVLTMQNNSDPHVLIQESTSIDNLIEAGGVAISIDRSVLSKNATPDTATTLSLVDWLEQGEAPYFACDDLPSRFGRQIGSYATGLLAVKVPDTLRRAWLMWFRPDVTKEVSWAGDPYAPKSDSQFGERLYPRTSFAIWNEKMEGHSRPWLQTEIDSGVDLANLVAKSKLFLGDDSQQ